MKLKKLLKRIDEVTPLILVDAETDVECYFKAKDEGVLNFWEYAVVNVDIESEALVITIKADRSTDEEDKADFIHNLGELLHRYADRTSVAKIEYIQEKGGEFAVITFENGIQKRKCITGDSYIAIMNDIYKILN